MKEYKIFKVLGDKTRYNIVYNLLKSDFSCCTDIAKFTKKDLSTISRQLKILENKKIIQINKINKNKCVKLKNKKLIQKIINDINKI